MSTRRSATQNKRSAQRLTRSARPSAGRLIAVAPKNETSVVKSSLPSLESGLRLYLLVLIAAALMIVGLEQAIDFTFLRFTAAIFIFVGFTAFAMLITRTRPGAIFGGLPGIVPLFLWIILGFVVGVVLWVPCTWLLLAFGQILTDGIGILPPIGASGTNFGSEAVVFVAVIPICEGLLFFGFLLSAARGIGNGRAILLIGVLFGIFGLFADQYGMRAIPAYFLLGLAGATLTLQGRSAIPGILVLSGFYIAEPLVGSALLNALLGSQASNLSGFPWLIAAAAGGFIAFALTRVARSFQRQAPLPVPAAPGNLWWLPLIVVLVLTGTLVYGEVTARSINGQQQQAFSPPVTGNTAAPVPGVPTVPYIVTTVVSP